MSEVTLDWFIGFTEGEGCWTWLGKWNNTTRGGRRVYYRRRQPQFLIGQNGRQVLDKIAEWLNDQGIVARVWPKAKYGRGEDGRPDGSGAHELRVLGYGNCAKLVDLFDGRLRVDFKRGQFERWKAEVLDPVRHGPVQAWEILGDVPTKAAL